MQERHQMYESCPSLAQLTMRLRTLTGVPVDACRDFLQGLREDQRLPYVEHMEANKLKLFVDPVELDRSVWIQLDALRREARERQERGEFGHGRGSAGRLYGWIKHEMLGRHGIPWRSPHDMNPFCTFD